MSATMPAAHSLDPPLPRFERAWQAVLTGALFCMGLFQLFSTAGIALALVVMLALALLTPGRLLKLQPWREPVMAIGLVLLAYIFLRTLLAGGLDRAGWRAVNHYHELLMVPLLWCLLRVARRPDALVNGLVVGCILLAAAHWLLPYVPSLQWPLHTRRISLGFGLAVCAFLLFEHARLGRLHRGFGYTLAAFLAATLVFAYDGRTGHLVLLVLVLCAAYRSAPARLRLVVVLAALAASLALAAMSGTVRARAAETWAELQASETATAVPAGARMELLVVAAEVVERGGALGVGWHRYPEVFAEIVASHHRTTVNQLSAVNPHNEYLLQLGAGGLPALLLFLAWLAAPLWRAARPGERPPSPWPGVLACITLAFALAAAFNSALQDFIEGHLYAALLAWLLVRRVDA